VRTAQARFCGSRGGQPPRLPDSAAAAGRATPAGVPDPELVEQAARRRFTAEYKLRILREAEACTRPGEIGALLRREGLYTSHLTYWRKQHDEGALVALGLRVVDRSRTRWRPRTLACVSVLSAPRRTSRRHDG
jgi:transposase-like protein